MNPLKTWLEAHRKRVRNNAYLRGYNWAAGALLRGDETPASVDIHTYGCSDPFDRGANDATARLIALGAVVNDQFDARLFAGEKIEKPMAP